MRFVLVPGGTFEMGLREGELEAIQALAKVEKSKRGRAAIVKEGAPKHENFHEGRGAQLPLCTDTYARRDGTGSGRHERRPARGAGPRISNAARVRMGVRGARRRESLLDLCSIGDGPGDSSRSRLGERRHRVLAFDGHRRHHQRLRNLGSLRGRMGSRGRRRLAHRAQRVARRQELLPVPRGAGPYRVGTPGGSPACSYVLLAVPPPIRRRPSLVAVVDPVLGDLPDISTWEPTRHFHFVLTDIFSSSPSPWANLRGRVWRLWRNGR
jgi:hypothetical protein